MTPSAMAISIIVKARWRFCAKELDLFEQKLISIRS
jgi:hypothetical protein